jgi:transposase
MRTEKSQKPRRGAPPRYDEAFKAGAVKMVVEQQRPSREVAADLGICIDTLRNWLKATGVQAGSADRQNREYRRMRELEAENRQLRKQLAEKSEAVEILKKSVGILSKP